MLGWSMRKRVSIKPCNRVRCDDVMVDSSSLILSPCSCRRASKFHCRGQWTNLCPDGEKEEGGAQSSRAIMPWCRTLWGRRAWLNGNLDHAASTDRALIDAITGEDRV